MNNPVPVEYVSSFTQANQSLMLHLATELLGEGGPIGDFQRFAEVAQVQRDYVQQIAPLAMKERGGGLRIPVMFEHSRHGERNFCILAG
jgi:hypothetical protein